MEMDQETLRAEAEFIIESVFAALDDESIALRIDVPIDKASNEFHPAQKASITIKYFNKIIASLVERIHKYGLPVPYEMPYSEACAEAVYLLQRAYPTEHQDGYEAAYLDAIDPDVGLGIVIDRMVDTIRSIQHEKHINWVFFYYINSRDWMMKCQIFYLLRERWREYLPEMFLECSPGVYANNLKEFILHFRGIEQDILREARKNGEI